MPLHVLELYRTIKHLCGRIISSRSRKKILQVTQIGTFFQSIYFSPVENIPGVGQRAATYGTPFMCVSLHGAHSALSLWHVCPLPPSAKLPEQLVGGFRGHLLFTILMCSFSTMYYPSLGLSTQAGRHRAFHSFVFSKVFCLVFHIW